MNQISKHIASKKKDLESREGALQPSDGTPPEFYDFELFPEYKNVANLEWYYGKQKYSKNQFLKHIGSEDAVVRMDGRDLINFSSDNYLGLANDPRVKESAKKAIDDFGTGVGYSANADIDIHETFEHEIAQVLRTEDAVVSVGGYSVNAFTIGYLCRPQDLILYDEFIHNSALAGCKMTTAQRISFPHNDFDVLEKLLLERRNSHERVFVLLDGVYNMDGDIPNVPRCLDIKNRHKAILMVDESHSLGVIGPNGLGVKDYFDLPSGSIDIHCGSMSKALGTCGGFVAGSKALVSILKNYGPGVMQFGATPTPANTAAGLQALRLIQTEPNRARRLQANAAYFAEKAKKSGLNTLNSKDSGIVPVLIEDPEMVLWLSKKLFEQGFCVLPMLYPMVPRNRSRLRFMMNADHTHEQLDSVIESLIRNMKNATQTKLA